MATLRLNLADLPGYLQARANNLRNADLSRPLKVARQLLISATRQNFARGASPDGKTWDALKRPRTRRKGQRGGTDLPLRNTGLLMASVTAADANSINEISGNTLRFGSSLFYAKFQQDGTRNQEGNPLIPPRPFLGLTDDLRQRIDQVVRQYVASLIGNNGG